MDDELTSKLREMRIPHGQEPRVYSEDLQTVKGRNPGKPIVSFHEVSHHTMDKDLFLKRNLQAHSYKIPNVNRLVTLKETTLKIFRQGRQVCKDLAGPYPSVHSIEKADHCDGTIPVDT